MAYLQSELIQQSGVAVLLLNTGLSIRLSFQMGRWVEKLCDLERRVTNIEGRVFRTAKAAATGL